MKTTNSTQTVKKLYELFADNSALFADCLEDLDNYNGCLGDDRWYVMDELSEILCGVPVYDVLRMAFFGAFNPSDDYFSFNGAGNLISSQYRDYQCYLTDETMSDIIANADNLYLPDEVMDIINGEEADE